MDGNVHYIYGQAEYATEAEAKDAALPQVPGSIQNAGAAYLATIVSQEGDTSIANRLYDVRPNLDRVFGFGTNGTTGTVADHGSLSGLLDDDHPQYLKTDGTRALTGDLDLGNNSINNIVNLTMAGMFSNTSTTTPQMRLGYDTSNYLNASVASDGKTTFDIFGTNQNFTFLDAVSLNGGMDVQGSIFNNTTVTLGDAITDKITFNGSIQGGSPFVFEGVTDDSFETTLAIADPTADRTVTLPDASGEVSLLGQSIESSEITDGTIVAADLGSIPINTLSDVDTSTSSPSNGQVLSWDGSNWVPSDNEEENIYSADGTLAGNRNVAFGGNNLAFDTNKLFIDGTSGNVGVGTASPNAKLDVRGDIYADFGSDNQRIIGITGFAPGKKGIFRFADPYNQLETTYGGNMIMKGFHSIELVGSVTGGSNDKVLRVKEQNTDRLVINKGGNVGIGTSSPGYRLDINGDINISTGSKLKIAGNDYAIDNLADVDTSTSSPSNGQVLSWDGSNWVPSDNEEENIYSANGTLAGNRNIIFNGNNLTFDTDKIFVSGNSGNVGIGLANPVARFHVYGSNANLVKIERNGPFNSNIQYSNDIGSVYAGLSPAANFAIGPNLDLGISPWLTIVSSSGNLGVGTVNPNMKITVVGDGDYAGSAGNYQTHNVAEFVDRESGANKRGIILGYMANGTTATTGMLRVPNDENLAINPIGGNVGIGTSKPGAKLEVSRSGTGVSSIFGRGNDANFFINAFQDKGSNNTGAVIGGFGLNYGGNRNAAIRFHRGVSGTGGYISFTTNNNAERVRITGNGRVGIHTTNPTYALELPNNANNDIGRARAHTWITYSDSRIKKNQEIINGESALELLKQLKPKSYIQYGSKFENGKLELTGNGDYTYGLIAQEVYKIPEFKTVVYRPENDSEDL